MKVMNWKSRKLWFSVFCIGALAAVGVLAAWLPEIGGLYPVFVGGVTGIAGLYLGSNVATKHVNGKIQSEPVRASADVD